MRHLFCFAIIVDVILIHCGPGKKHQGSISVSISMPLWRLSVQGAYLEALTGLFLGH